MPTTRIMHDGRVDLTGQKINTLLVQGMVSRRPEPSYNVVCERCNTISTATHSRLRNGAARCQYAGCGKASKPRGNDLLSDERQRIAEREAQRRADELKASDLRMAAESADWERPERYAPAPDPHPQMSARDVAANRERRAADEAERLAAEAPRLEAEAAAAEEQATAEAAQRERDENRRRYFADWILNDRDPKLFVSPELTTASMSKKDAAVQNAREVAKFIETTPEFAEYQTPENGNKIVDYLLRNGITISDSATYKAAFVRLRDLGILTKKSASAPQPVAQPQRANVTVAPVPAKPASGPQTFVGRDHATGADRTFTQREVDRMSSLEYRRAFPIIDTVSELFSQQMSNNT